MAKNKFQTVEEIRADFIKNGWSPDTNFTEVTIQDAEAKGFLAIAADIRNGEKYFQMNGSGNIFDNKGEVAYYNIKSVREEMPFTFKSEKTPTLDDKIKAAQEKKADKTHSNDEKHKTGRDDR